MTEDSPLYDYKFKIEIENIWHLIFAFNEGKKTDNAKASKENKKGTMIFHKEGIAIKYDYMNRTIKKFFEFPKESFPTFIFNSVDALSYEIYISQIFNLLNKIAPILYKKYTNNIESIVKEKPRILFQSHNEKLIFVVVSDDQIYQSISLVLFQENEEINEKDESNENLKITITSESLKDALTTFNAVKSNTVLTFKISKTNKFIICFKDYEIAIANQLNERDCIIDYFDKKQYFWKFFASHIIDSIMNIPQKFSQFFLNFFPTHLHILGSIENQMNFSFTVLSINDQL